MLKRKEILSFLVSVIAVVAFSGVAYGEMHGMTYTGCLNNGGNINKVAVGESPAKPCEDDQMQISWNAEGQPGVIGLANKNCGPGDGVVTGFDEDGMPVCGCLPPFTPVPDSVSADAYWSVAKASIDGGSNTAVVEAGSEFTVSVDYTHLVIPDCPACIIQFQLGFSHLDPGSCLVQGFAPMNSSGSTTFTAPDEPGTYYIHATRTLEYSCLDHWKWANYPVAAICVK